MRMYRSLGSRLLEHLKICILQDRADNDLLTRCYSDPHFSNLGDTREAASTQEMPTAIFLCDPDR
jgi:hypothetical protein